MKKVLLSCTLLIAIATFSKVNAQCSIGIPNITNAVTSSTGDSCFVTFDLSFAMKNNNGNKTIGIDLWQGVSYVSPSFANVPSPSELAASLGSLMIDNNFPSNVTNVTFRSSYPSGSSVRLLRHGMGTRTYNATVDSFYFALTGIKIGAARAGDGTCPVSLLTVKGNVWSTNAGSYNPNTAVHCYSSIGFSLGNPTIPSASANCQLNFLNFSIATTSSVDITVTYKIFKDDNLIVGGVPVFNSSTDNLKLAEQTVTLSSSNPYASTNAISYPKDDGSGYWVVVYYTALDGQTYSVSKFIQTCLESTLPVTFKSFTVARNNQMVAIKWETAFEQNNRGFYVQRNVNGEWKDIAFVFSKADGGNSTEPLSYVYNDPNTYNTVSYYRVLQVDLSGLGKYSEIRVIRGEELASKLMLFPNPGTNGKVNVIFIDETSAKSVIVYDATGRAVKTFKNIAGANLTIEQLKPGVYNIQVINAASQAVSSAKFIIKD